MISACKNGDLEKVKEIILKGEKMGINEKDDYGFNGFLYACINGHFEIVKLLIENNSCKIEEKDYGGFNGFIHACLNGHYEIVKLLIENNFEINEKN